MINIPELGALAMQLKAFALALDPTIVQLKADSRDADALSLFQAQTNARFAAVEVASTAVAAIFANDAAAMTKLTQATTDLQTEGAAIAADKNKIAKIVGIAAAAIQVGSAFTTLNVVSILSSLQALSAATQ